MHFVKMHGAGNDYVFVNCFLEEVADPGELSPFISDRHKGVGADGLILLQPSARADARMRIFNADGSEAEMCGNGIRCAAKLLRDEGLVHGPEVTIETLAGIRRVFLVLDGADRVIGADVEMGVPVVGMDPAREMERIEAKGHVLEGLRVSVGNPHFVIFVDDVLAFPVREVGPRIEGMAAFPERSNVEFVQVCNDGTLLMRVWERGSGETLACGTGAVAAVAAAMTAERLPTGESVSVRLQGGDLAVRWDGSSTAWLAGDAVEVFRGVWRRGQENRTDSDKGNQGDERT